MGIISIILWTVGVLVVLTVIIRFATRKKTVSGGMWERVKDACCIRSR